jgi:LuxR family transcriptional regulator, maltose regulon positive regulatory protein
VLDGSASWDAVGELLAQLPRNGHLVIGSRTMPPLSVRRLQASGDAVVVEQEELAFTDGELDALVEHLGIDPAGDLRLPSWPALAVLAGSAGVDASLGYLWEEILAGLPDERRRALAIASRLEQIDDELVLAVAGPAWSARSLVAGLPLVQTVGDTHRLHDLWRAALADAVEPGVWRPALEASAEVYLRRGERVPAVKLLRDAGNVERMLEVARQFISLPISAGLSRSEAEVLFDLLPAAVREGPVGRCLLSILRWGVDEGRAAMEEMLDVARTQGDDEMRALAIWRLTQAQSDTDPVGMVVSEELQSLADDGWPLARSAVALVRSHEAQGRGDVTEAVEALRDLGGPHPQVRRVALSSRLLALGHPEQVGATLADVLAEGVVEPTAAQAVWFCGGIDPDIAWPIASGLPELYGQRRFLPVEVPLLSVVSGVALAAGATAEARRLADAALERSSMVVPRGALFAHVADALVALVQEGEAAFTDRIGAAIDRIPLTPWPSWAYLSAIMPIRALVPDTEFLDDLGVGPGFATAIAAGRAIEQLRSGAGPAAARALPWDQPSVLRVHVPPPLLCELALAARELPGASALLGSVPGSATWVRSATGHLDRTVRGAASEMATKMPVRPPFELEVEALGGLVLRRSDGVEVANLDRRGRLRQLLAHLVVGRSVARSQLAEQMWPDLGPDQAANNLRVTLSKLLDVLEPERTAGGSWWIRAEGDRLELVGDGLRLDVDEFEADLREARLAEQQGAPSVAYERYEAAVARYHGPFLAGVDDAVVAHERFRLQGLAYAAACRQAELLVARGEPEEALRPAAQGVRIDAFGERAYRLMIGCQLTLGARSAAQATAALLEAQLAVSASDPEPETLRVLDRTRG